MIWKKIGGFGLDGVAGHSFDVVFHGFPAFGLEFGVFDEIGAPVLVDSSDEDL
jgi:hypothetical protein